MPFDRAFTCDCSATQFSGENCDIEQDTKAATNGPNGQGCAGGLPIDVVPFDQAFTCDCSATKFTGDNCNVPSTTTKMPPTVRTTRGLRTKGVASPYDVMEFNFEGTDADNAIVLLAGACPMRLLLSLDGASCPLTGRLLF